MLNSTFYWSSTTKCETTITKQLDEHGLAKHILKVPFNSQAYTVPSLSKFLWCPNQEQKRRIIQLESEQNMRSNNTMTTIRPRAPKIIRGSTIYACTSELKKRNEVIAKGGGGGGGLVQTCCRQGGRGA
jgi:hypothetical protein